MDRVVVLLEGFDLYNRYSATDNLAMVARAADALRARGIDILVVSFPDSHLPPDELAPLAARAIQAASRAAGGRPVAVAGLSAGGLVARWALVTAEQGGAPLPAHVLFLLDTPNRGANLHPALQAMTLRYGTREDKQALQSRAARVLLGSHISDLSTQVTWKKVGLPLADRRVPVRWTPGHQRPSEVLSRGCTP
jgi:triacylglycerol esterase/lipase EstA (alpha/beta hydrolase family)